MRCSGCKAPIDDERLVACPQCGVGLVDAARGELERLRGERNEYLRELKRAVWIDVVGVAVLGIAIAGVGLYQVYTNAVRRAEEAVLKEVTNRFNEKNVQDTLQTVAATRAADLIASVVRPEMERTRTDLRDSVAQATTKVAEIDEAMKTASEQLAAVAQLTNLLKLQSRAQAFHRPSFDELRRLAEESPDAEAGVMAEGAWQSVRGLYSNYEWEGVVEVKNGDGTTLRGVDVPLAEVVTKLKAGSAEERGLAARALSDYHCRGPETGTVDRKRIVVALVEVIGDEPHLVSLAQEIQALYVCAPSLQDPSRFSIDRLDTKRVREWWDKHKSDYVER